MKLSPTELGVEFEDEIAKTYQLLGYDVEKDVDIDGQQIDLLLSHNKPGIGKVCYIVECKYKSKGKIDNQEVLDFITVFDAVRRSNSVSGGVLVTNRGFTRSAKRIADPHHEIFLVHASALKTESVIRSAPGRITKQYEESAIFRTYVPQRALGRLPKVAKEGSIRDVAASLLSWTSRAGEGTCFVLGDYGTGKTTLLTRIRYTHLKWITEGAVAPIPVIFLLKNSYKFDKLDDFVVRSFHENYHSSVEPSWSWSEADNSGFVLLLDGFDEISIESNVQVRQMLFARIAPLLYTKSPTLISCRPSYFIDTAELDRLVMAHNLGLAGPRDGITRSSRNAAWSAQQKASALRQRIVHRYAGSPEAARAPQHPVSRLELLEFNTEQIKAYLARFEQDFADATESSVHEIYDFIRRIYGLSDLMSRPILLDMIVETILSGSLDLSKRDQAIGPATLYEIYTDGKLAMEASKGFTRQLLSLAERKEFAQVIAFSMYKEGVLDIKFARIVELVKQYGDVAERIRMSFRDEESFEVVANDVKLCGFLQRERERFRFSHRSFMEFFLARKIFRDLKEKSGSEILDEERPVPRDVLYFLGSLLQYDDMGYERVLDRVRRQVSGRERVRSIVAQNWMRALACTYRPVGSLAGIEMRVEDISVKALNLFQVRVQSLFLKKVTADSVEIQQSEVGRLAAFDCGFGELIVSGGRVKMEAANTDIAKVGLNDVAAQVGSRVKLMEHCRARGSTISIEGETKIMKSEFVECTLRLVRNPEMIGRAETAPVFQETGFAACRFEEEEDFLGAVSFEGCKFEDCYFGGVRIRGKDASAISARGRARTELMLGCKGYVFVRNQGAMLDPTDSMGVLLGKFAAGSPVKREEAEAADRMLRANVTRVGGNDVVVINAFYWNKYEKFQKLVRSEYLGI